MRCTRSPRRSRRCSASPRAIKLAWRPQTHVTLTDVDEAGLLMKLIDALDDDDDVQTVWSELRHAPTR